MKWFRHASQDIDAETVSIAEERQCNKSIVTMLELRVCKGLTNSDS